MRRFKLVTFDAYTGLADFKSTLLPEIGEKLGLKPKVAATFLTTWRTKQLDAAALSNALGRGRVSFHDCTSMALKYAAKKHGVTVNPSQSDRLIAAWYPLQWWPEAGDVLRTLKKQGYELALLSNGDRAMLEAIAAQGPVDIDHIFSTEDVGIYKPAPAIYDLPLKTLGLERTQYLHVAGGGNDVIGAKSASIACYWNNRTGDQVLYPKFSADHEAPDLRELLKIL